MTPNTIFSLRMILAFAVLYWFPVRRWFGRWGATTYDLSRVLIGDSLIANLTHLATFAIAIDPSQEDIWPWLVQMGAWRGGLHSYD